MLRAVTNMDFPKLRQLLKALFDMELDYDPSIRLDGRNSIIRLARAHLSNDPEGRIRILFIRAGDLSFGMAPKVDVTGFNIPHKKLTFIGIPESVDAVSEECIRPGTMDGYLLAITFHELYELLTGDFGHCDNARRCINAMCDIEEVGTCSACMGSLIDQKYPDITLEDIYCEEHLAKLNRALAQN